MKKYVTVDKNSDGLCLRTISEIMTKNGDKMNHMTVKNIVTRGFLKIAVNLDEKYKTGKTKQELYKIAQSPEFQLSVVEIMNREKGENNE